MSNGLGVSPVTRCTCVRMCQDCAKHMKFRVGHIEPMLTNWDWDPESQNVIHELT